jgi:putative endonuclease
MSGRAGNRIGLRGEAAVAEMLIEKGWRIAAQRLRLPAGEVDIVAINGDRGLVVEVKATAGHYDLVDRISTRKLERLTRLAEQVSVRFRLDRVKVMLAAVVIVHDGERLTLHELDLW